MLPNRTYNGLADRTYGAAELKGEAMLQAELSVKGRRRCRLMLGADRRMIFEACKKARQTQTTGALDALQRDFYIVERAFANLEDVDRMRLPVLVHGSHTGLPRVYGIAANLAGSKDGRIDENALGRYLDAYQSVTPLTMVEIRALCSMLTVALVKLLSVECSRALDSLRAEEEAETIAQQLGKRRMVGKQNGIDEKLRLNGNAFLVERLYAIMSEKDMVQGMNELKTRMELEDQDIEQMCARARSERERGSQRIQNAIHSIRVVLAMDWDKVFEQHSHVHRELMGDETYGRMEARSRGYYRAWVERLASSLGAAEPVIARRAVQLAAEKRGRQGEAGYYLFMDGREQMYAALRPDKSFKKPVESRTLRQFITAEVIIALLLIWLAATEGIAPLVLALIPAWSIAGALCVRAFMARTPVRYIPRLKEKELGQKLTLVVIPALITDEKALRSVMEQMERHMLSTGLDCCRYAVLGDFVDADKLELRGEKELLRLGEKLTSELNKKYPAQDKLFYYLHRHRELNRADGIYMGRERKRGAICDLVTLLAEGKCDSFCTVTDQLPKEIAYCLTLDADTILPPGAAASLIGCMEHPLNKPEISCGAVRTGYGIISPRMVTTARSASRSRFVGIVSSTPGVDGYFPTAPEFYQDVFGCGLFGGKGIFDVAAFRDTVMEWIPDNTVLSHDMLEGCFLRCGYAGDVALYDGEPATFISWWKRQHRWIRGDWQLVPFLYDSVRDAHSVRRENPLTMLSRRKILDNLRRSMLPWVVMYTAMLVPYTGFGWHCLLALLALWGGFAFDLLTLPYRMITARNANPAGMVKDMLRPAQQALLDIVTLPYTANRCSSARNRSLYRMFISHRRMLEWQTAAQISGRPSGINGYYGALYFNPAIGIVMAAGAIIGKTPVFAACLAVLWIGMPLLIWALDESPRRDTLSDGEREMLMDIAQSTWGFFESFCKESTNFLPPDNFQQHPHHRPVLNTSPTNIGMGIMAILSAWRLDIIELQEAAERIKRIADTLERMEKWHGHLYNWYRTDTLEVLCPRYVSTVDSGNLAASLLTAARAMEEEGDEELSLRLYSIAKGMEFGALYDSDRKLFRIGYDGDRCEMSPSWYDLMASEARVTSLVAIALGQVEHKHWFCLGRPMVPVCGRSLVSWSGTMFEYLMPVIFTSIVPGTLLSESCESAVRAQRRLSGGQVWGISESGYYAFDRSMYYQYRAFGIQRLSLTGQRQERVISPYSTLLALPVAPKAAMENIYRLNELGALGLYGMYEGIDYEKKRLPEDKEHMIVKSYMAHHQGMGICSIANVLKDDVLSGYFWRVPELGAVRILNEERIPSYGIGIRALRTAEFGGKREKHKKQYHPRYVRKPLEVPESQLLTNGSYTLYITDSGQGFSKRRNIMMTRWRVDALRGSWGVHIMISTDGRVYDAAKDAEAVFLPYKAEFTRREGDITSKLEVCVCARQEAEMRKVTLTNHGTEAKSVEIGGFFEPCICEWAEEAAHPGFNRLTIDAALRRGMLIFEKRPKEGEHGDYLYTKLISPGEVVYLSDRLKAVGRGKTPEQAMLQPVQEEDVSSPVLPYAAARTRIVLEPGEGQELYLLMGYADSVQQALEACEETEGELGECFALAEAHTAGMLMMAGIEPGKADLFERIAARVMFGGNKRKGEGGSGGLGALWRWGISGDRPVVLIRVSRVTEVRILKALGEFSVYMAQRLWPVDVAAVGDYPMEYRNELRERMEAISGIHIIHGYDLTQEEYNALRSVAVVEIDPGMSLNRQFSPKPIREAEYRRYGRIAHEPLDIPKPEPEFDNGLGGFLRDGEYVISLDKGEHTPMPWCNVIANGSFGTMVSEKGGGYTWSGNSRENRLTPWQDSPVDDPQSEFLLLTDMDSGQTYSPFAGSLQQGRILIEHGFGYSRSVTGDSGLHTELTVFVHREKSVKYSLIRLKNPGEQRRKISVMYGVEWCLGDISRPEAIFTHAEGGFIFARNCRKAENKQQAYIASSVPCEACSDRTAIFRAGWDAEELPNTHGLGCAASVLRTAVHLEPGEEKELFFCLGEDTREGAAEAVEVDIREELRQVKELWRRRLGGIVIHTPNPAMDRLMNGRLLYQVWAARILGRCGYYQSGGAYGFRDQLQDMLPLMHHAPERAREHILLCASKQFKDGDVLHWWHSPSKGVRTRISDDRLFLPYVTAEYVETTGDTGILSQMITYLAHRPIPEDRKDLYEDMQDSREKENLYMHCVRAVDSIHTGFHGLPLMGGGDWNDGMDRVGENGGESVWLGWFMMDVLSRVESMANRLNKKADARRFAQRRERLRANLEKTWDGAWYPRAYYGDGTPLGTMENSMCRIDCISQAWAAICGGDRANEAIDSLLSMLYEEQEGIVKLLTPPFDPSDRPVGYIQAYIPGVRENGGQYTHGAAWVVKGLCALNRGDKALAVFDGLNPINHTLTRPQAMKYKTEPYAVAGDVYTEKNIGRGGWTWYTGAAGWLYKVCLEDMLGVRKKGDTLEIAPTVPFESYTVEYRYGESMYILRLNRNSRGKIKLVDDGFTHDITIGSTGD
ncbi:MAG: DUF3131 domain-containing protein [Clostridia bacterium]|nr:DUF3131 domain-containing protein [Clostridia bacterium]